MIRLAGILGARRLGSTGGIATAALLLVGACVPLLLDTSAAVALLVGTVIAAAVTAGATASDPGQAGVLDRNGATTVDRVVLAVADIAGPAGLATAGAVGAALASAGGARADQAPVVIAAAGPVPLLAAAATALVLAPRPPLRRGVGLLLVVVTAVAAPPVALALVVAWLASRGGGRLRPVGRVALTVLALAVAALLAVGVGQSQDWFTLSLGLTFSMVPLILCVAWLGAVAVGGAGLVLDRFGAPGRMAAAPLRRRRAHLGPVAAGVGLIVSLAVMELVVGASFGEREARRPDTGPTVVGQAGTAERQAIVVSSALDPADVRTTIDRAAAGAAVPVAVIDHLGTGGTETSPGERDADPAEDPIGAFLQSPPTTAAGASEGPTWVGVARPEDLAPLGLADRAPDLAAGRALVLNPEVGAGAEVEIATPDGTVTLPAVDAGLATAPLLLPAVLVSPEVAATTDQEVRGGRVVVAVPSGDGPEVAAALTVVDAVATAADAVSMPSGSDPASLQRIDEVLERPDQPFDGAEELTAEPGGPLNDVPYFSGTAADGRARARGLALAALLVCVAGTALVLVASRAEDAVIEVQGGSARSRVEVAALQAGAVALAASVVGGTVGIGLPALAMDTYSRRPADGLPDIPVVVPGTVAVLLVALPLVAAAAAALVVAVRRPPATVDLAALDL